MSMAKQWKKIGTHSGIFHCDEVTACFLLKKLPEYVYSEIIRTRDQSVLDTCDVVVDVGSVYDPERNRFDHHQKGFNLTMHDLNPAKPWKIKLSSAGLVYHHFGERVLRALLGSSHDPEIIPKLYDYVYENFIMEIDAIDNGVSMFDGKPAYKVHTGISSRIGHLNPLWNSKEVVDTSKLFQSAMDVVGREFIDKVQTFIRSWWPARRIVAESVANRFNVHSSGEVIELSEGCPWKDHLLEIEKELDIFGTVKFAIFQENANSWRVVAVPVEKGDFECRVFLKEEWRGLNNEELVKVSGIDGCIFVHSTGFIGGNKTRDGALEMALKTLVKQEVS